MITINLFDYRQELKQIAIQKQVLAAIAVPIVAFVLCVLSYGLEQTKIQGMNSEIEEVQAGVTALDGKVKKVKTLQTQGKRLSGIIEGMRTFRSGQRTPTRLLEDIYRAIPDGLWLDELEVMTWKQVKGKNIPVIFFRDPAIKIKPKKKKKGEPKVHDPEEFVRLEGFAFSDQRVANFIEGLEKVPYFKVVFPVRVEQTKGNREFLIYCYMGESAKAEKKPAKPAA